MTRTRILSEQPSAKSQGFASLRGKRPYAILLAAIVIGGIFPQLLSSPAAAYHQECTGDDKLWYGAWHRTTSGTMSLSDVDAINITAQGVGKTTPWQLKLDGMVINGAEITEQNSASWKAWTSYGTPDAVVDNTTDRRVGASSTQLTFQTTDGIGNRGLTYPASGGANWDLSSAASIGIWVKSELPGTNQSLGAGIYANKGTAIVVTLANANGGSFTYSMDRGVNAKNAWSFLRIPLADVDICYSVTTQNSQTAPLTTTFDFSSNPSSGITNWRVDANGDGTWDANQASGGSLQWTYSTAGMYEARLEATDSLGAVHLRTLEIAVAAAPEKSMTIKVLRVLYQGGTSQTLQEWLDMTESLRQDWFNASGGFVNYQVVGTIDHSSEAAPTTCVYLISGGAPVCTVTDVLAIFSRDNLDQWIKNESADELWIRAPLQSEGYRYGPGSCCANADAYAGTIFPNVDSGRSFGIQPPHFGDAGMGHSSEHVLSQAFATSWLGGNANYDRLTAWADYTRTNGTWDGFGNRPLGVGSIHVPCNDGVNKTANGLYDQQNETFAQCVFDRFLNYPYLNGSTRAINCTEWYPLNQFGQCDPTGIQNAWVKTWWKYLPRNPGRNGTELNNWFKYTHDFNRHPEIVGGAALPNAHITLPSSDTVIAPGGTVTFKGHGHDPDSSLALDKVSKLTWSFGDGSAWVNDTTHVTLGDPSTVTHTFPTTAGTYNVTLRATDELGRNSSPVSVERINVVVSPPDLRITEDRGDTRAWPGETISHRVVVKNQGGSASAVTTLRVHLSNNSTLDATDLFVGDFVVPALGPGEATNLSPINTINYSATVPSSWTSTSPSRTRYILLNVDPNNYVTESNETNNSYSKPFGLALMTYDVNGDGYVTQGDNGEINNAMSLNCTTLGLKWNPDADLTGDCAVSVGDIGVYTAHYGDQSGRVNSHLTAGPQSGAGPLTVTFTYKPHYEEGLVTLVEIDWDLNAGNGYDWSTSPNAPTPVGTMQHTYTTAGTYTTRIRATDNNGYVSTLDGPSITVT